MKILAGKIKYLKYFIDFIFVATVVLWIIFTLYTRHTAVHEGLIFNYLVTPFLIGMTLIPLFAGIIGVFRSSDWGGWQSIMGKSLLSFSLGMFGWAGGMIVWNYYLFFAKVEVPYPSLGDLFYIMIWPFWTYGMIQLSKVTGAKYGFKKISGKAITIFLAVLVLLLSYYFLFKVARNGSLDLNGGMLANLLAFLYPIGDVAILFSSVLVFFLSYKFFGGLYKVPILILILGFVLNYVTDVIFVFTTTNGTYFNGHISDLLYVIMLFTVSWGMIRLNPND